MEKAKNIGLPGETYSLMKITVVTAITGEKDQLREDFNFEGAEFLAYVDDSYSLNWQKKEPHKRFYDPVRNAKIHKVLIHKFISPDTDVSIWIDGNINFNVPASQLVEQFLEDGDMWAMTHFYSTDAYHEGSQCHILDNDPNSVFMQLAQYKAEGYKADNGMYECNVLIRRNNERVRMFNEKWWAEICCGSRRDQVAFPYALHEIQKHMPLVMKTTKGNVRLHPYFNYKRHNFI